MKRKIINGLNAKEYEDELDAKLLKALRLNPAFDIAIKKAMELGLERMIRVHQMGSNIMVTENNMPDIYNYVKEGCEILGITNMPPIYIEFDPAPNAYTTGAKEPILVITTGLIDIMDDEELCSVIGHELGHIKSEHVQYHIIGDFIISALYEVASYMTAGGGISAALITGLELAYYEWYRRSEISCDRAGLLVSQNLRASVSSFMKLAGLPKRYFNNSNLNSFIEQAKKFEDIDEGLFNKMIKFSATMWTDHPWLVMRAKYLLKWVESGEYARIICRDSSWLGKERQLLQDIVSKKEDKMNKSLDIYTKRKEGKEKATKELLDLIDEHSADNFVGKKILNKGHELLKNVQKGMAENSEKGAGKESAKREEAYNDAVNELKDLENIITSTDEEQIKKMTDELLGALKLENK